VRHKGERVGRNPRTGVEIMIPERKVLRFKVSQVLKDELNGDA
jgi:integration host factor subunit alpha